MNLQPVSDRVNCIRGKAGGSSKYPGVSYDKIAKKWAAKIAMGPSAKMGCQTYLGLYIHELDAASAYMTALKKYESNQEYFNDVVKLLPNKGRRAYLLSYATVNN